MSSPSSKQLQAKKAAYDTYHEGQDYFYGRDRRRPNFRRAFPLLLIGAKAGFRHAQNLVGFCLDHGKGVARDHRAARRWYAKAARAGHVIATLNLAISYELGIGGKRSPKRAVELYKIAAKAGDAWAQCNLGVCYLDGVGVKENRAAGLRWMKRAAMQDEPKAQFNMGQEYAEARGKANRRRAIEWLTKASSHGHKQAKRLLAKLES